MYKDSFLKLKLKWGKIEKVEDFGDKLYKLQVNFGGEIKTIIAGIKEHLKKEEILGKECLFLYNIEPKKIKGIYSEGMLLVGEKITLIEPVDILL